MESVFDSCQKFEFWIENSFDLQKLSLNCTKIIELRTKNESDWVRCNFRISSDVLIELDENENPQRFTSLKLKLLQPFIEESEKGLLYGFRLGNKDFFVDSPSDLDEVIETFRERCVLNTFEEDFAVIKQIGRGSSSIVYLVQDLKNQKEFAAKCIKKQTLKQKKNGLLNLIQEVQVLQEVNHPFIVKLYYVYETVDCIYLILEYFCHGDLYRRLSQRKAFSEKDSMQFSRNILEVLEYLHSKSIVHRDIKLENIMMTSELDFTFKLIDFGLSYSSDRSHKDKCGSPGYMAPEILNGKEYNQKIDIFSAGVLVYITLTGNHPFNASSPDRIINNNLKCLYKVDGAIKGLARDFIMKMLTKDASDRFEAWELLDHPWLYGCRRGSVCVLGMSSTGAESLVLNS